MLDAGPYHCPRMVNVLVLLFRRWWSRERPFPTPRPYRALSAASASASAVSAVLQLDARHFLGWSSGLLLDSKLLAVAQGSDETNLRPITKAAL